MGAWVTVVALAVLLAGCTSPEASRVRGGGSGGDVGNRDDVVTMHEGSQPYYDTPRLIVEPAPRERQAADGTGR